MTREQEQAKLRKDCLNIMEKVVSWKEHGVFMEDLINMTEQMMIAYREHLKHYPDAVGDLEECRTGIQAIRHMHEEIWGY